MSIGFRVFAGAALGGTASLLSGGKFANGAITGALVVLFNHISHSKSGIKSSLEEYDNQHDAYARMGEISNNNEGAEVAGYHMRKYHRDGTYEDLYLVDPESAKYSGEVKWDKVEDVYNYKKAGYQLEGINHTHPSDPYGSTTDMRALYWFGQTNGGNIYLDAITNSKVYRYNFNVVNRTGTVGNYKYIMAPRPMAGLKAWYPDNIFTY